MAKRKRRNILRSYNFVRDPVIEVILDMVDGSGKSKSQVRKAGGPAVSTLRNWENNHTRSPLFRTVAATARSIGGDVRLLDPAGKQVALKGAKAQPSKTRAWNKNTNGATAYFN